MPVQGLYGWPDQRGDQMRGFPGQGGRRREPARLVQSQTGSVALSTITITMPAAPTQGNWIVVGVGNSSNAIDAALVGCGVTTWTRLAKNGGTGGGGSATSQIWIGKVESAAASTSLQATFSGGGAMTYIAATEWRFPYDGAAGNTTGTGGSQLGGGAVVRNSGTMATRPDDVVFICWYITNNWTAASSGWTYVFAPTSRLVFGYQFGLGASVNGTATDSGSSMGWGVSMAAIR